MGLFAYIPCNYGSGNTVAYASLSNQIPGIRSVANLDPVNSACLAADRQAELAESLSKLKSLQVMFIEIDNTEDFILYP